MNAGPSALELNPPVAAAATGGGWRYGWLGMPLAFAALPMYVQLPDHYATLLGAPLAGLGAVLLLVRALDAGLDPWLGPWIDRALAGRPVWRILSLIGGALVLVLGLAALFRPPTTLGMSALLGWCAAALLVTGLGHSVLSVMHQAWAARLGGSAAAQTRWAAWREGFALMGVLTASAVPVVAGVGALAPLAAVLLAIGIGLILSQGAHQLTAGRAPPRPEASAMAEAAAQPLPSAAVTATANANARPRDSAWLPWRTPAFRTLVQVQVLSGVASAIPATLVLFFIRDRLERPDLQAAYLIAYFLAAGCAVPLWTQVVRRAGLVNAWAGAMLLACASFVWAAALGPGDALAFGLVCLISGTALGADLVAPAALLTGVLQRAGHGSAHEGRYLGWWSAIAKLNLALAAGLALPLLQWAGYQPGDGRGASGQALGLAYALLPCGLKLCALAWLWRQRRVLSAGA